LELKLFFGVVILFGKVALTTELILVILEGLFIREAVSKYLLAGGLVEKPLKPLLVI